MYRLHRCRMHMFVLGRPMQSGVTRRFRCFAGCAGTKDVTFHASHAVGCAIAPLLFPASLTSSRSFTRAHCFLVVRSRTSTLLLENLSYLTVSMRVFTNETCVFVAFFSPRCPVLLSCFFFQPSVTLLKLNNTVAQDLVAPLALSLVDLLAAHRPALDRVIIAAAVQSPKRHQVRRRSGRPAPKLSVFFLSRSR